jgi:photosystem II stability/assembly factor-like uncharacterized protein
MAMVSTLPFTFRAAAALLALLAPWAAAGAGAQTWVPVGPPGGDVRSLAADPSDPQRLFLGTADGVLYRSEDAGLNWTRLTPGFPLRGRSLDDIVVDPRGSVLVGFWEVDGSGGGVARSIDGGRTFSLLSGIEGHSVRALAQAPTDPATLVVGTLSGVYRSRDGGRSWRRISPEGHPDLRNVGSVAIDHTDPETIYIGTWHLPWKTSDGGRTWAPIATGMIDDSDVMTMTIDRRDPRLVYATACSGIYRSADAAGRWTRIRGIPSSSRRTRSFAQSADNPDVLFAGTTEGVWSSEDGGTNWRQLTRKDVIVNAVLALPGHLLLAGTDGAGVLRSTDSGRTWAASNRGFSERFVSRVAFDPEGGRVLVGVWGDRKHGGVFWASRPEGTWAKLGPGLEGREVLALAVAGSTVVAGTDDGIYMWPGPPEAAPAPAPPARTRPVAAPRRPPLRAQDPADTGMRSYTPSEPRPGLWTVGNTADSDEPGGARRPWKRLRAVAGAVDPHPRVTDVVALPGPDAITIVAATSHGMLRSIDGGQTWRQPTLGTPAQVSALASSPSRPGLLLAATALGFFLSRDGGDRWSQVSPGVEGLEARSLAFLPSDDSVVFATTRRGLFRSLDHGRTWARCTGGVPFTDITGLAVHPDGRTLYATEFGVGGIFRSRDGGESWSRLPADGLMTERAWTIALDPKVPERVLVASPSGGLHLMVESSTGSAAAGSR